MTIIGFIALPVAVMCVAMVLLRRQLQTHDDRVRAAWRRVQVAFENRHELARQIAAGCSQPNTPSLAELQAVLKQAEFTSGLAMKGRVENHLSESLRPVVALGGDELFAKAVAALPESLVTVRQAAIDYNARVSDYNAQLTRLPTASRLLGCEPREPFFLC